MEGVVYLLCAATALACSLLLLRGYGRKRTRLLLWCGLCFVLLAAENVILFIDMVVFPHLDLSGARTGAALAGATLLVFGLVWDAE